MEKACTWGQKLEKEYSMREETQDSKISGKTKFQE